MKFSNRWSIIMKLTNFCNFDFLTWSFEFLFCDSLDFDETFNFSIHNFIFCTAKFSILIKFGNFPFVCGMWLLIFMKLLILMDLSFFYGTLRFCKNFRFSEISVFTKVFEKFRKLKCKILYKILGQFLLKFSISVKFPYFSKLSIFMEWPYFRKISIFSKIANFCKILNFCKINSFCKIVVSKNWSTFVNF